ncbi:MAG: DUF1287 domain-containing protein [Acidobacteriota bacterium]|nr:DUF1287 domain-containing protein [Acidobacteriota bacterium]
MNKFFRARLPLLLLLISSLPLFNLACGSNSRFIERGNDSRSSSDASAPSTRVVEVQSPEIRKMLESAVEQTRVTKNYDGAYVVIPYPMGDVPAETGVCTDVVIRAFRRAGTDLQREVHEDMRANFAVYPKKWGLPKPDTNIDHRRVPNLQTFFTRRGKALEITRNPADYQPGDVISWDIDGKGMTHIGLVSNLRDERAGRFLIIHNMGWGAKAEDVLFRWQITGHYRYF